MLAYLAECVLPGLEPGDRAIVVSHGEPGWAWVSLRLQSLQNQGTTGLAKNARAQHWQGPSRTSRLRLFCAVAQQHWSHPPPCPSFLPAGMAIKCLLRGILNSLPSMSRNILMGNTAITEVGFVPRKGGGSSGSCNGSTEPTAAAAAAAGHGGVSPGHLGEGTWHVLRVNDLSHLSYDLRS